MESPINLSASQRSPIFSHRLGVYSMRANALFHNWNEGSFLCDDRQTYRQSYAHKSIGKLIIHAIASSAYRPIVRHAVQKPKAGSLLHTGPVPVVNSGSTLPLALTFCRRSRSLDNIFPSGVCPKCHPGFGGG